MSSESRDPWTGSSGWRYLQEVPNVASFKFSCGAVTLLKARDWYFTLQRVAGMAPLVKEGMDEVSMWPLAVPASFQNTRHK